jgi:hypothetical protein
MEKTSNGMKFARWQVPIRLVYAGTVHRSQGMTLQRAVVDLKRNFWEHGQLYVALSRVSDPMNLCLLLPDSSALGGHIDPRETPIRVPVDGHIAEIISRLYSSLDDDHVVSSDDHPPSITECSESQHSAAAELSPDDQRQVGALNGVHDSSQGLLMDEQSDYHILSADSAMM